MIPFGETALCVSLKADGWPCSSNKRLPPSQQDGERKHADLVDETGGEQSMHEFSAALCEQRWAVFPFQLANILDGIAQRDRALPSEIRAFARSDIFGDPVEGRCDVVVRSAFGIGPVGGENIIRA